MDKPTKPINLMPRFFGGIKNNFSASLQSSGYEPNVPAIYGGDNVNYQLDATGKELEYCEKIVDFINGIPIGKTITVDNNNKLVYDNLATDISGKANIDLDNLSVIGEAKFENRANIDLDNLSATGENHFANKDLSNLTSTGKTEVINLAYELDYDNIITITTTSSNSQRTYVCPDDGIVFSAASVAGGSNAKNSTTYIGLASDLYVSGSGISTNSGSAGSHAAHAMFTFFKGQTAYYLAYATGGTSSNEVWVKFIPFKKS